MYLKVESLKTKLTASETLSNRLQSQLASSEEQCIIHKESLTKTLENHKSSMEVEKHGFSVSLEELRLEKDKVMSA